MYRISIQELEPGMIVGRSILNSEGNPLLIKNTILTSQYIDRLEQLGLGSVYIKDGLADVEVPEVVSQQVQTAVARTLKQNFNTLKSKGRINSQTLKKSVAMMIDSIASNREVLFSLEDIRAFDDYLFYHSINVSILSIMTGFDLGYNELQLMELGVGALLHDLGLILVDQAILNKPGPLTADEMRMMQKHPEAGFNILRAYDEISLLSAHIAYQHHERWDGSGYPRNLSEDNILEYGRIVAIADVFDALLSDRPYRKGYTLDEVTTVATKLTNRYFDPEILEVFLSNIAAYPVGSLVKLNNGAIAVVISASKKTRLYPSLAIIVDHDGNRVKPAAQFKTSPSSRARIVHKLGHKESQAVIADYLAQQSS
ncbi:MAG: HD-GYP domain-containing protein [Syntrophomonadaceae bacterium]|nr:HD-GYP domain-containing protein [Syntrophomonadaceae bacterium]